MSATAVLCWVLAVSDGDTLKVRCADHASAAPVQVRIVGIDAPERRQAFGVQSRTQLQTLCLRRRAQLQIEGVDKYQRTLAQVQCQWQDVAAQQVRAGLAWVYLPTREEFPELQNLEHEARGERRGLWSQRRPLPPWEYRRRYAKQR